MHHALLFLGEGIEAAHLPKHYQRPSSDVTHIFVDSFGIDDVRSMTVEATQMPVSLSKRTFVIVARTITMQAQNALLKLFEEPPVTAQFYVVVPNEGMLLPTLLSRMHRVHAQHTKEVTNDVFGSFFASSYAQRMEIIATLAKAKDTKNMYHILEGAEHFIQKQPHKHKESLRSLLCARSYIAMPGASAKMLLEEVALSLPKM